MGAPKKWDWETLMLTLDYQLPRDQDLRWPLPEVARQLGVPQHVAGQTIHLHRNTLGDDSAAVLAIRGRKGGYWISTDVEEIKAYERGGLFKHFRTETKTMTRINARRVRRTSGRLKDGKIARIVQLQLANSLATLDLIEEVTADGQAPTAAAS